MSASEETVKATNRGLVSFLSPATWGIRWKIRIAMLAGTLFMVILLAAGVYLVQRKVSLREAYDKVTLLHAEKARQTEGYFNNLTETVTAFATDRQMAEVFNQFKDSFLNIENESFTTTGAESIDKMNSLLEAFYTTEIIPVLEMRSQRSVSLPALLPGDIKQRILQYLYLAGNDKPMGSKQSVISAADGSSYSSLHRQYHTVFAAYARKAGIADILLVDYKSGYVVYSLKKNLDYATNLYEGPYKNSTLGTAFKTAIGLPAQDAAFTDESRYAPALLKPVFFVSAPIYNGNELTGAVIFQVEPAALDALLSVNNDELHGASSLKSLFLGEDLHLRNNDPEYLSGPKKYLRALKRNNNETAMSAQLLSTTAMIQEADPRVFTDALNGIEKSAAYVTATGQKVLCTFGPLQINGLNWILVSQIDKSEALLPARRMAWILALSALLIGLVLYLNARILGNTIADRLTALREMLAALHRGESPAVALTGSSDEIGASMETAAQLAVRMRDASVFIKELGKGNIDNGFEMQGEKDQLGISLNELRSGLVINREEEEKRKQADAIRNWTTQGIAMFNDILRLDNNDLGQLSLNIIRNIIQYLSANQGGLFLLEDDGDEKYLNLTAAFAYDRQKFLAKKIGIGEGLAGSCVLEKKTVLLRKIPDNYIEITSGLGGAKPACLLIVPMKKEDEILGVLEIASFSLFLPHEVEFVEKVAESIASALITVRLHQQTSQFLERFQQQAEEMKAQDEELRQNIEELQATHEQMERLKQEDNERNQKLIREIETSALELQKEKALLDALLENVPENIYFKDKESKFIRFSRSMLTLFGLEKAEDLLGKSDFDFFADEHARPAYDGEQEIIRTGKAIIDLEEKEVMEDGRVSWVNTTKMPLVNSEGEIIGTFGISKNISKLKKLEFEAIQKADKLVENEANMVKFRKLLIDILDKIPAKVFLKDENGVFVVVNTSVAAIYGKTTSDIIGTSDYDNHPDEDVDSWRKQELEIMKEGQKTYLHSEAIGGITRHLKTLKMPFNIATTESTGLLGIQLDVTEMKQLEDEVRVLKDEINKLQGRKKS